MVILICVALVWLFINTVKHAALRDELRMLDQEVTAHRVQQKQDHERVNEVIRRQGQFVESSTMRLIELEQHNERVRMAFDTDNDEDDDS